VPPILDGPRYEERRRRHITARVETVIRGDAPVDSLIAFDVLGGIVDGIGTLVPDSGYRDIREGERYLILKSRGIPGSEHLQCWYGSHCIYPVAGDSLVKIGNREVPLPQVLRDIEVEKWRLFPGSLARKADLVVMGTVLGMEMPWIPTRECPDSAAIQIHHVYRNRSGPKVRRGEILPLRLEAVERQGMTWVMPAGSEMILMLERRGADWVLPGPWHHALRLVGDEVWVENGGSRRRARIARWSWSEVHEALSGAGKPAILVQ
jgi:hypothetical protein